MRCSTAMETRMPPQVVMEALSPTMEEGRLVEWKKQEGEAVAVGDVLAEVETDKAVMELVARAGGTLLKQVVTAGATVPVSQLVAVIGEPGEAVSASAAPAPKASATPAPDAQSSQPSPDRNRSESMPPAPAAPQASEPAGRPRAPGPTATPEGNGQPAPSGGRVKASPLAKRMAADRGIDLAGISAKGTEGAPKVSFNDLIIKATALALRRHPACNAWWQDDRIRYWNEVHISMAVAIEEGLITPVIRHADRKSLREISAEARDLAGRARERRLAPEEYTGGTFSISNLGMLDIDEFTAVINPPEAGILAIGRIVPKPVAHDGAVQLR